MSHCYLHRPPYLGALLLVVSLVEGRDAASGGTGIAYSDFRTKIQDGQIKEVSVGPDHIYGTLNNGSKFSTVPVRPRPRCRLRQMLDPRCRSCCVLRAAADAEGRRRGRRDGLRQIQGQAADREIGPRDV
ncbi:MAG: ATP-dependent metallopeptidase FtsH/Yme1/Tma family protein [Sphingobium sp.]|nr:ATP-dependent metallopeptidase FtsH/Yme1/Tma family protein [Sphingobium sp.]